MVLQCGIGAGLESQAHLRYLFRVTDGVVYLPEIRLRLNFVHVPIDVVLLVMMHLSFGLLLQLGILLTRAHSMPHLLQSNQIVHSLVMDRLPYLVKPIYVVSGHPERFGGAIVVRVGRLSLC